MEMEFHRIDLICAHKQKRQHFHAKTIVHWLIKHGVGHILLCGIFGNWGHWGGGWARGGHSIYCSTNIIQEIEGSAEHPWGEAYWSTFVGLVWRQKTMQIYPFYLSPALEAPNSGGPRMYIVTCILEILSCKLYRENDNNHLCRLFKSQMTK